MTRTSPGIGPGTGGLPRPRTTFVGRGRELTLAGDLLQTSRLLTLTGPGGSGKTRLSLALAAVVADAFPDGVHFVALAPITDASLVPTSIAQSLSLQDSRGQSLLEHLSSYLADRTALIILDNFEHLLSAGEFIADLLGATTNLRIVVTSRTSLHLSGEQELPVPPLSLPEQPSAEGALQSESVQLFAARAAACVPTFAVTPANAAAVVGIVQRLDGLPLAIELAAARVKLLPPEAILARLGDSLSLLVGAARDVPERQRTLRATIAWSYQLLSRPAQRLFSACSVFRGSIALDLLEAVADQALQLSTPVLDCVQELVEHSLLRLTGSAMTPPRYAMLATIADFAAEQLRSDPAYHHVCDAHAGAMWRLAQDLARPPSWPDRSGLDLLESEHDNFRAALDRYAETDHVRALQLANRLTAFWSVHGHFSEGRRRLRKLRVRVAEDDPEAIDALLGEAWLATDQADRAAALPLLEASLSRARAGGDTGRAAAALLCRGRARLISGDPEGGRADIEEAYRHQLEAGDNVALVGTLWLAGAAAMFDDATALAIERLERGVALAEVHRLPALGSRVLQVLGLARLMQGEPDRARIALATGVPAIVELGDRFAIPVGLSALAGLAAQEGRPRTALILVGAAEAYEQVNHTHRPQMVLRQLDAWLGPIRARLGAAAEAVVRQGCGLTPTEAVELGLAEQGADHWGTVRSAALTPREQQVAGLVAEGLRNREIAGRLSLSVRTVEVHVDRTLTKLGFSNRTRLAAWAHQQGLAGGST